MSDKKTKSEIVNSLQANGNSKLNKSFKTKLNSFLSKPIGKLASIALILVLLAGVAFGAYNQITKNSDTARAGLNCPAGSNSNGSQCISTTPSSYVCPGTTLGGNGAQCFVYQQTGTSYSCPSGGSVSGASCVATDSAPFTNTGEGCNNEGNYSLGGQSACTSGPWQNLDNPNFTQSNCNVGFDTNRLVTASSTYRGNFTRLTTRNGEQLNGYCWAYYELPVIFVGTQMLRFYQTYRLAGFRSSNYSIAATPSAVMGWIFTGNATPQFNTVVTSGASYTPENGQITGFNCTPSTATSGGNVVCSGQATGAPSGIPYVGNITVTINNGGGTATTGLTSAGNFSTTVDVGTITGTTPVVKNATTNIGGTSPITVTAASIAVDPDLASGDGSVGNSLDCTASTNVIIGETYTCNFPINGTGPFVLPSGGIQARTNQATNNSNPVTTCTVAASVLTCTGIATIGTPSVLIPGSGNVQLGKGTTPATWNTKGAVNLVANSTTIVAANISNSTNCATTFNVTVGNIYSCDFPLTGNSDNNYTLPTNGITAATSTATGISPVCTIDGNGTAAVKLVCSSIPTTGGTIGNQNVLLTINNVTPAVDKGDVNIVANSDILLITRDNITLTPNPITQGLSIFGNTDYTIIVKDDRIVANGSTAVCTYKVKELSSPVDNANRGWDRLTSTIIAPHNNNGTYNTTTRLFEVNYNTTTTNPGTSIKITKENQKFTDYDLEIRCKRNSDGQIFGRDERINFLFGSYSVVTVSGVVV